MYEKIFEILSTPHVSKKFAIWSTPQVQKKYAIWSQYSIKQQSGALQMAHVSGQMELLYQDLRTPFSKQILTLWSTPFGKCFQSNRVAFLSFQNSILHTNLNILEYSIWRINMYLWSTPWGDVYCGRQTSAVNP